jgi:translation elongation factor EF-Tu-like GTPase
MLHPVGCSMNDSGVQRRTTPLNTLAIIGRKFEGFRLNDKNNFENPQDEHINKQFVMPIEDIFVAKGRGLLLVGRVQSGMVRKGDAISIIGGTKPNISTYIAGFEGFMHDHDNWVAMPNDNTAILVRDVESDQLEVGMIIKGASV